MRVAGIIAEYNPFHSGHKWHLEQARQLTGCDFTVVAMSGSFMQRGEPAMFDKWSRAEMAVLSGADLVLELPVVFAVRSAEFFAAGGVRLLGALGVVSHLCFGAEHPELPALSALAEAIDNAETIETLQRYMTEGLNYAAALGKALQATTGVPRDIIASPNNILAVEYIRAIKRYAPALAPVPATRRGAGYHDTGLDGPIASATAVRQAILAGGVAAAASAIPAASRLLMEKNIAAGYGPVCWQHYSPLVLAKLRTTGLDLLEQLPDAGEGLHHKLKKAALTAGDVEELLTALKVKRYPRTRLQRLLVHALLGTTKDALRKFDAAGPLYARVLAFNCRGRELLSRMASSASVPVITKTTHYLDSNRRHKQRLALPEEMLAADTLATDIYVLGMPTVQGRRGGWDFRRTPAYIPCSPAD